MLVDTEGDFTRDGRKAQASPEMLGRALAELSAETMALSGLGEEQRIALAGILAVAERAVAERAPEASPQAVSRAASEVVLAIARRNDRMRAVGPYEAIPPAGDPEREILLATRRWLYDRGARPAGNVSSRELTRSLK